MTHTYPLKTDITIIGGALAGMTLACALAGKGFSVAVVEQREPEALASVQSDGRTSAISQGSKRILDTYGLWESLIPEAGPIWDIRVSDAGSPHFVHYDHALVSEEPMGYIIENHFFLKKLYEKAATLPSLQIIAPAAFASQEQGTVILQDGRRIEATLVVAADGRHSPTRKAAGIDAYTWSYHQTGLVCNIRHEKPHQGIALERFLPAGPFASLPMHDPYVSSLVWTEKTSLAPLYLDMGDEEFCLEIQKRLSGCWGDIHLASKRFSYPLSLLNAKKYHGERLALVGDAAHAIHPIAGQGFNLGIRDVGTLAELILHQHYTGLDIGATDMLQRYTRQRQTDSTSMISVTDGLNRLFSNCLPLIQLSRRLGLSMVNHTPPLKRFFMKHAMGL